MGTELKERVAAVLSELNATFNVEVAAVDGGAVTKVVLNGLKDEKDGSEFVERFCELFGPLVETLSDGAECVVFEEETGLVLGKANAEASAEVFFSLLC